MSDLSTALNNAFGGRDHQVRGAGSAETTTGSTATKPSRVADPSTVDTQPARLRKSWLCKLGIHSMERSQGDVGYCMRPGCDNLLPWRSNGSTWTRYVEKPTGERHPPPPPPPPPGAAVAVPRLHVTLTSPTTLTAEEARALRVATSFGSPPAKPERPEMVPLQSGLEKLRRIEQEGSL